MHHHHFDQWGLQSLHRDPRLHIRMDLGRLGLFVLELSPSKASVTSQWGRHPQGQQLPITLQGIQSHRQSNDSLPFPSVIPKVQMEMFLAAPIITRSGLWSWVPNVDAFTKFALIIDHCHALFVHCCSSLSRSVAFIG